MAIPPILYVLDGHAIAYRQFHGMAHSNMVNPRTGEPTNAVYGFARLLIDLLKNQQPHYIVACFDEGLSGREAYYPDYKAQRSAMPESLDSQMSKIFDLIHAFNIPILTLPGYEADDIIGTLVEQAKSQNVRVHIITGDRDLLQLLDTHVRVQLPSPKSKDDDIYDSDMFIEKWGISPRQLVDYKALVGDQSDNIPGVKGIGDKTATKLLQNYGTLEALYDHLPELSEKDRQKLIEGNDNAFLSQRLARIMRDVPIQLDLEACKAEDYDPNMVNKFFEQMEFITLGEQFRALHPQFDFESAEPHEYTTIIVDTPKKLADLVAHLNSAKAIVFDTETTGVDQMQVDLVGIALATDETNGYYIPVGHVGEGGDTLFASAPPPQLSLAQVIDALRPSMTNPNIPKIAHNAGYDYVIMRRHGLEVYPIGFDTMIAEWVRNPDSRYTGLKRFATKYLRKKITSIDDLIGTGKKQITMAQVAPERAGAYAVGDVTITYLAWRYLTEELHHLGLMELYTSLELPLIIVLSQMESNGVLLDVAYLAELSQKVEGMVRQAEATIHEMSGENFNINSPKQLSDVLFGRMGLPTQGLKKTTHGFSTDAPTLEKLYEDTKNPIIRAIIEYRELVKLKGTYIDALPQLVNPKTGRLHTNYNQTGTNTGRLSSNNPNLQNIPIRTELGREVRRAFIAPEGYVLLSVDYSQIELRILAHISEDATLLEAFARDEDIHATTAAAVFGIPLESVTYDQRSFAKRVNFGLIYGMGEYRLARDSDLSVGEARKFIDTYFKRLPGVKAYLDKTREQVQSLGYVDTLFGRRRYFPVFKDPKANHNTKEAELRAAINHPIQGTAADIMKRAMIQVHDALKTDGHGTKMLLQVHDELVFEVPRAHIDAVKALVLQVMEGAYPLKVRLKANAEIGANWRDMSEA
jgi:DNA polymerase-1